MKTLFKHSYITFITLIFLITVLSSFVIKSDVKKEGGKTTIPFWKQANAPDYTAPYLNPKPANKEPDKKQAKEFMANAKQNVSFLENKGQMMDTEGKPVPFVLFKAEAPGMNVYITEKGLTYVFVKIEEDENEEEKEHEYKKKKGKDKHQDLMLPGKHEEKLKAEMAWINVNLKGASIKRENIIKEEQSTEHFNYFYGHCPEGIYDVYQYKKLTIKNVYPNIDWVFYNSSKGGMKYDFIVHPGANPNDIKLIYDSEKPLDLDKNGNLQLKTKLGTLTENAPYSYLKETNTEVKSSFKTIPLNKHQVEVAFNINQSTYTQNSTLVIDPQLVWGTFYGGDGNDGTTSCCYDNLNNLYIIGYTGGANFPTLNSAGAYYYSNINSTMNSFVVKFNSSNVLLWSSLYNSYPTSIFESITVDGFNNIYIVGNLFSASPQNTFGSNVFSLQPMPGAFFQTTGRAFLLKFNSIGARVWATFLPGFVYDIDVDSNNNLYIVGQDIGDINNFAVQVFRPGAYNQQFNQNTDGMMMMFNSTGQIIWNTDFGSTFEDLITQITIDNLDNIYISGSTMDYFDPSNPGLFTPHIPLTFPMGSYSQTIIPVNNNFGNASVFIAKFNNNGALVWSTLFGPDIGAVSPDIVGLKTDSQNNLYVLFETFGGSNGWPILSLTGAFNSSNFSNNGDNDFVLAKFNSNSSLVWCTVVGNGMYSEMSLILFYGGRCKNDNLAIDNCGNIYVCGDVINPFNLKSQSCSQNNPVVGPTIPSYPYSGLNSYIIKFNFQGELVWDSYIGGDGADFRSRIAVDNLNNISVVGEWCKTLDLVTQTPYPFSDISYSFCLINPGSGAYFDNSNNGSDDVFILKLTPSPIQKQVSQLNTTNCNSCDGSATFSITCGDAPYSYVWSNGTSVLNTTLTNSSINNLCAGVYSVTVTSGCTQTVVETYTISGTGAAVAQANILPSNTICAGQSLTLSTVAANTYTWAGPDNFTAYTQNAVINNAQVTSSGVYTISIDSGSGCTATATIAINIQAIDQPNVNFTYQASYCISDAVAKANLSNGFSNGGTFLSDAGLIIDATTGAIDLTNSTAGTYTVNYAIASAFCRTAGSNTAQVILNKSPLLELNPNNLRLACGQSGTITVTGADDYTWSNSALLDCATCSVVVASPYKTTDFCVTGTSKNCTSQTCVNVTTEQTLDVPNAFTPNGDNNNDEFCLQGWAGCVQSFAISVFDRWGQEVFTSNKANFCWDGTYQGKALNTAVFVYSIKANIDGKQISKKGNITLLR